MATKITDFADAAEIWQAIGPISTTEASLTSDAVDLIDADGPAFAILSVGPDSLTASVMGSVQSSADGTTWNDLPDGAFDVEVGSGVRAITFQRPQRYLRVLLTLDNGGDPLGINVILGQSHKML